MNPDVIRANLERSAQQERSIREELGRLPHRLELEVRINRALDRLLPRELSRLKLLLTEPQTALASRLRSVAREVLLGHDQEHAPSV